MRIIRKIRNFFRNIIYSCKWFIRTWGNYDWDYNFLYEIMKHKLQDMEKYFRTKGIAVRRSSDSRLMRLFLHYMDIAVDESGADNLFDLFNRKYPDFNVIHKGNEDYSDKLFSRICKISRERNERYYNKAMYIFSKYFRYWWD